MFLYNTLTRKKEKFKPLKEGAVSMYHCGPTVYDYAHIGNFRSYVMADILRRTFEYKGYAVKQVMNITDVGHLTSDADEGEDKMTLALKREGKALTLENMKELADTYARFFKEDLKKLNIKEPHEMPRASEHISAQVALIKRLEEKGLAYRISDGIYFDTQAYPEYGKLAGSSNDEHKHPRIGANKEKKNHRDFALWKFSSPTNMGDAQKDADGTQKNAEDLIGWESPWGNGFPGWHIECSAMSMEALGESFDIHTGGIDHIGTHHTNEMAQSEAATGKPFVRYWLHNEFVSVDGEKMSKSKGNIITLKDFEEKGIDPLAYRYWLLTAHYRTPVNFTWEALEGAETALRLIREWDFMHRDIPKGSDDESYLANFSAALENDLDTPKVLALIHEMLSDESISQENRKYVLHMIDAILGLQVNILELDTSIPDEVTILVKEREIFRKNKNWRRADEMREEVKKYGYDIKDTQLGPELFPMRHIKT